MASAWGLSWGSAWGNSWGSVAAVVVAPPQVGSSISGGSFTRKRWRELKAAWAAQEAAEMKAAELKKPTKRKKTLAVAAKVAEQAIKEAHAHDEIRVLELTRTLQAAASAGRVATSLHEAQRAIAISRAIIRQYEDEEEEELLMLLLA